ncbi:MAG TPA: D-2-hydroxyacid dehydrogenase family protein [Kofleriaceae bacterium]|jgi:phosphoglycerate dehydrogenase-like enzyme
MSSEPNIAVLDDFQNVALKMADWSPLDGKANVTVFTDHVVDDNALVERLLPFDIICVMRERTPLPRAVLERLPRLKLIASTGVFNSSIDLAAAKERGIEIVHTRYDSTAAIELTWALILAGARHIAAENASLRSGGWQQHLGSALSGSTLGILGLGHIGGVVAKIAKAFNMNVVAWSENLTPSRAAEFGARHVSKEQLFRESDVVSIHLVLSRRTRGLVSATELGLMKPTARLVNTSRGAIVVEADLISALREGRIANAALDVFDEEPLPPQHPFRTLPNVLATPHIGFVSDDLYRLFYGDTVTNIVRWLEKGAAS